ncbi:hypothetical protein ABID59_003481 [Bradyrhizobium sp. S3.3.6]
MRATLLVATAVATCISLYCVGATFGYFHQPIPGIEVSPKASLLAFIAAPSFAVFATYILRRAPFSFGYVCSIYFLCIVVGYLWINPFSRLPYDHQAALVSAFLSGAALLVVLVTSSRLRLARFQLRPSFTELLPYALLVIGAVTVGAALRYNFHLVGLADIYQFRDSIDFPMPLRYANGIVQSTLLPFAFACFVERRRALPSIAALVLMAAFYPATLSKFAAFAPFWLLFLLALQRFSKPENAVILSVLLPLVVGLASLAVESGLHHGVYRVFGLINFRMFGVTSISMEVYNAFFYSHAPTHFCQIGFVRSLIGCPYDPQLGVELARAYELGNFNASLLSTEGIASVGTEWAPLTVLASGAILAFGSAMASHLPARFVLLSSGIVVQQIINVPLSTALLSHGAALLFLLWWLTPKMVPLDNPQ